MDEKEFKVRAGRLEQIGKILEKLPAEVRGDAFELLRAYVAGGSSEPPPDKAKDNRRREESDDSDETFFSAFDHHKPADNAKLIAAWFYREYGVEPFSVDEVTEKANGVGITIPARVDMTFVSAKENGKNLFARAGTGRFKPTVHGEAHLKAVYSVKKGTKRRTGSGEAE